PLAGTTRDMLTAPAGGRDRSFNLVDMGGLFGATTDPLHELVVRQGLKALDSADLMVFVVDAREGLVPADQEIARRLRALGRPLILALNKTDDKRAQARTIEFYELGFEPVMEISAEHGHGVAELLDAVILGLPSAHGAAPARKETSIAIVGRPNVGKSSLVN